MKGKRKYQIVITTDLDLKLINQKQCGHINKLWVYNHTCLVVGPSLACEGRRPEPEFWLRKTWVSIPYANPKLTQQFHKWHHFFQVGTYDASQFDTEKLKVCRQLKAKQLTKSIFWNAILLAVSIFWSRKPCLGSVEEIFVFSNPPQESSKSKSNTSLDGVPTSMMVVGELGFHRIRYQFQHIWFQRSREHVTWRVSSFVSQK